MTGEPAKWYLALPLHVQALPAVQKIAHLADEMLEGELTTRAKDVLAGKSRSLVEDAIVFAVFMRSYEALSRNLTATQMRCTTLLEENRALRK